MVSWKENLRRIEETTGRGAGFPFFEPQWPGPVFLCNLTAGGTIKNGDMSFLLLWDVTKSLASARMFPMFF
jgi:hypothetical protein